MFYKTIRSHLGSIDLKSVCKQMEQGCERVPVLGA